MNVEPFRKPFQMSTPNATVVSVVSTPSVVGGSSTKVETIPGIQCQCTNCETAWNVAFVSWEFDPANAFKCKECGNWSTSMKLFRDQKDAPSLDVVPDQTIPVSPSPFSDLPTE